MRFIGHTGSRQLMLGNTETERNTWLPLRSLIYGHNHWLLLAHFIMAFFSSAHSSHRLPSSIFQAFLYFLRVGLFLWIFNWAKCISGKEDEKINVSHQRKGDIDTLTGKNKRKSYKRKKSSHTLVWIVLRQRSFLYASKDSSQNKRKRS